MRDGMFTLVCTRCQVVADHKGGNSVVCPKCGSTGGAIDVTRARRVLKGQAQREVAKGFQDTMRKAVRGSKHLTYTPGRVPTKPSTAGLRFAFQPKGTARNWIPPR